MTTEELAKLLREADGKWCNDWPPPVDSTSFTAMAAAILARYDLVPKGEKV